MSEVVDSRGIAITPGVWVAYGSVTGVTASTVVGRVAGRTPSGRIRVEVAHRTDGRRGELVHVAADRLIVITGLPEGGEHRGR